MRGPPSAERPDLCRTENGSYLKSHSLWSPSKKINATNSPVPKRSERFDRCRSVTPPIATHLAQAARVAVDDNLLANVVNANYHGTVPLAPPSLIMVTATRPWSMTTP